MSTAPERLVDWLDRRLELREFIRVAIARNPALRAPSRWTLFNGVLLFALVLQVLTGALLLVYYVPHTELAFASVQDLLWDVPYGWLIRLLHAHGASLMIALSAVYAVTAALRGAYKTPRELLWIIGALLLLLTFAAALTGYILPWSQLSYWATTISTGPIGKLPVVGPELLRAVRGSDLVGPATLSRAFTAHVALIPLAMLALTMAYGFAVVRTPGDATPPPARGGLRAGALELALAAVAYLAVLAAFVFFAPNAVFPPEAFLPADPLDTPLRVKPEWYFLWAYELQRRLPGMLGVLALALLALALLALPFLDRSPHREPHRRPFAIAGIAAAVLALVVLSLLGSWT